jgi:hypothetical protein
MALPGVTFLVWKYIQIKFFLKKICFLKSLFKAIFT